MAPSLQMIRKAATKKRKEADGAPAEKRAKIKVVKRDEAEASGRNEAGERKRPWSPSPAPPPFPIDLSDTPLEQRTKAPSPSPTVPKVEPTGSAARPAPEVAPSTKEVAAEKPLQAEVSEASSASDPAPVAQASTDAMEEGKTDMPSFQSILAHHSCWAERMVAQVHVPELQSVLQN